MKKSLKVFLLMTSLLLLLSMAGEFAYALSGDSVYTPRAVSRITISVDRTSSSKAVASISGATNSVASSITMTATLYEYNSAN